MSDRALAQARKQAATRAAPAATGFLQRKCACGTHAMGGECEECKSKKGLLQRASLSPRGRGIEGEGAVPPIIHEVLRSPGQPLDSATRAFVEPRFGRDFSQVRVHTDAKAAESARAVNALAYTLGRDLVFDANQYAPRSFGGQRLLTHELTHVVQQQGTAPGHFQMGPEHDSFEREADSVASGFGASSVRVQGALALPALQRQPPPPKEEPKKEPGEKTAISQPPAQKIPVLEVRKEYIVKPAAPGGEKEGEKKGTELTATLGTETEIKRGEKGTKAEAADKFEVELAVPITEKLQVGHLSFLKEASVAGSLGFPAAVPYPKPLSSLELETSLKVLSLEFEKVKVPLGLIDLGISGSALGSAGYSVAEGRSEFKAGFAGEAEAKFTPGGKGPFFITAKAGVERTYDKEGNAYFKWSPVTWKTFVGAGFKL